MLKVITKEIPIDEELKTRIQFICDFCNTTPTFINGSIRKVDKTTDEYRKDNFNLKYELQELKHLFEKIVNFLKRMFHRKDKEDVYAKVVSDLYDNQIISEKTFDKITGWDNEKDKEKDDYEL